METFKCSYKIMADIANNRLYMIIKGQLKDEYVQRAVNKTIEEVNKLSTGFDLINDISELHAETAKDAAEIQKAHYYILTKGVNRIVKIDKKNQENKTELNGYTATFAKSVKEAEKFLAA